jgi:hypothetical protein
MKSLHSNLTPSFFHHQKEQAQLVKTSDEKR